MIEEILKVKNEAENNNYERKTEGKDTNRQFTKNEIVIKVIKITLNIK